MKKKILIRIGSLRHGGAEKVLVTFLKNLPPDKYEIDLLLNLFSGKYIAEVPSWVNLRYLNYGDMITTNRPHEIPIKAWRKIYQGVLKKFPKILYSNVLRGKQYNIEIAFSHDLAQDVLHSPQKISQKVLWLHSDIFARNLPPQNLKDFKVILTISDQIHQEFHRRNYNNVIRIYNPIEDERIRELANTNTPEDSNTLFLSVGTVYHAKGFDLLINAHQKLLHEGLNHNLLIIGDGPNYEKTIENIKARGLENTVLMPGFIENPYPYFRAADFYVLSSRYEGYPTVLFEALTLKKKIISTDVSGAAEMLENGKLGLLVENSEEGIYNGMKQALTAPESFNKFEEALAEYEFPFSLENSVNNLMQILDDL